jgi:predicted MFS family arabinose efflux permease
MFTAASFSHIAATAPPDRRAEAFGIFGLAFFLPVSVGGWLGEWVIRRADYNGLFAAAIGMAVVSALFPIWIREPETRERLSFASLSVFLGRAFLVPNTAGYLFGMAYGTIITFLPVYLLEIGKGSIGVFVFVYAMTVIATRVLGRRLLDRLPRERMTLFALLLLGMGNLLIPFAGTGAGLAAVGAAAGGGHGLLFPALSALVLDRAKSDAGGMAMAMFTGAFDMGMVTGAAAFGFVVELYGYGPMFVSAAAAVGAGSLGFFLLDPSFRKAGRPAPGP